MANDTKERILVAALEMFSQNGYAGTNIRELSASLGLVKSGVYKHFESKEAIWNALLDQMITYYADHFGSAEHLPPVMMNKTTGILLFVLPLTVPIVALKYSAPLVCTAATFAAIQEGHYIRR